MSGGFTSAVRQSWNLALKSAMCDSVGFILPCHWTGDSDLGGYVRGLCPVTGQITPKSRTINAWMKKGNVERTISTTIASWVIYQMPVATSPFRAAIDAVSSAASHGPATSQPPSARRESNDADKTSCRWDRPLCPASQSTAGSNNDGSGVGHRSYQQLPSHKR